MNEKLTTRVSRIISGSLNALVDAIENAAPETVMMQAIREVDQALDEVRNEYGKVVASKHLANTRLIYEHKRYENLGNQLQVAIDKQRDDLAEAAISQQLDIEAQIPVLEATIAGCSKNEKELEAYISALQAKRRDMKQELKQFRQSQQMVEGGDKRDGPGSYLMQVHSAKVAKAQASFERVVESTTGVNSSLGPSGKDAARIAELEQLSRNHRIKERLQAAKAGQ